MPSYLNRTSINLNLFT